MKLPIGFMMIGEKRIAVADIRWYEPHVNIKEWTTVRFRDSWTYDAMVPVEEFEAALLKAQGAA